MSVHVTVLDSLPKGWTIANMGDISLRTHYGYTAKAVDEPIGPKMLRITDIQNGAVDWTAVPYCKIEEEKKDKYLLRNGDLVFARTGATVGKSFLIKGEIPESVFASYLIRIILSEKVSEEYVYYFFQSPAYWSQIYEGRIGIGQPNVNASKLSEISLSLAPLNEQHRIVARVEELFTKLDAGVESLGKVKTQLQVYRKSVFKAAIEGKFTKEWRNTHKKELETSSKRVERILRERQTNWEEAELAKMLRKNKTPGKKKNLHRKSYRAPIPSDPPDIDLPNGWIWTNMDTLTYFTVDYRGKTPPTAEKGIPIISAANVRDGKIVVNKPRYVTQETYDKWTTRGFPKPGDLIITTEAPTGEVALYPENKTYLLTRRVLACQTLSVINQYLIYCFKTEGICRYLYEKSRGTTVPRILKPVLMATSIPLPPLLEQQQIVNEVEFRISVADKAERIVEECIKQSERLRKSVLKKAFEGKLVPQDPTDEPAEKLLERIREKKEKLKSEEKKKKSNRERGLKQLELVRYVK